MKKNNYQSGAAHLILLVGILVVAILSLIAVMIFKPDLSNLSKVSEVPREFLTQTKVSPTATLGSNLEAELNSETLSDPSEDFGEVDKDINTL